MAEATQSATGDSVEIAFIDEGYAERSAEETAAAPAIQLEAVKLGEAKCGFVLLPRRWVLK